MRMKKIWEKEHEEDKKLWDKRGKIVSVSKSEEKKKYPKIIDLYRYRFIILDYKIWLQWF